MSRKPPDLGKIPIINYKTYLMFENVNIIVSALYSNHTPNDGLHPILISSQNRDNVAYVYVYITT